MNKDIEFLREFKEEIIQAMELLKLLEDETDEQNRSVSSSETQE